MQALSRFCKLAIVCNFCFFVIPSKRRTRGLSDHAQSIEEGRIVLYSYFLAYPMWGMVKVVND